MHPTDYLDHQADTLAQAGHDLIAEHIRSIAAQQRALERRVADLERENSRLAYAADAAIKQLRAA